MENVESLKLVLANSYALYIKTHCYHWNVVGPNFMELHTLFEAQYNDLFLAIDRLAERIRSIGSKVPASFSAYKAVSQIGDANENFSSQEMIKDLFESTKKLCSIIESALKDFENDEVTKTILADRLEVHQKNTWFLKSLLS